MEVIIQHALCTQILYEIIWTQNIDCPKGEKRKSSLNKQEVDWFPNVCMQNEMTEATYKNQLIHGFKM